MKKVIVAVVSALLVTSLFASTTVSLSKSLDAKASAVQVNIKSDKDVYGVQFDLRYNPTDLSLDASQITSMINGVDQVYAKVKEDGFVRVVMFDLNGSKIHDSSVSTSSIISIPFASSSSKGLSSVVQFDNVIVAGFNGEDLNASSDDYYMDIENTVPTVTSLSDNYPNPFNPTTNIEYNVSKSGFVSIVIYDMNGAEVRTLVSDVKSAASYSVAWNGLNNNGQSVSSGKYVYRMSAPGFTETKSMTLLK
tara:strand:- start:83 stop:832 length:750 start_codon:yes stop_codon:yes gene_type:complete